MLGDSTKDLFKDSERCLDSQLWHACAGGMVQMPLVNSKVYYFPQGQAEHSVPNADFGNTRTPAFVLCRVSSVKFLADRETDEVLAKLRLVPIRNKEADFVDDVDDQLTLNGNVQETIREKPASFAKTLTQSDANNGGGFSVPRYCAETIFPRLDYSAEPPVQTVLAKDVHGEVWKFRHIYRGTPRRHLLTTGWSTFVNQKKLVAGDSIVFVRTEIGELCVGIRRVKREMATNPNPNTIPYGGGFSMFLREEESKMMMRANGVNSCDGFANVRGKGRVNAESVVEAATLAANGEAFEVVYYPRASTPEFCVKASAVRAAMRIRWCSGMRFKMAFETEDSSRISWFMGTICSAQPSDPLRWPNSPWRLLEVTWDEPDLLQNVKRVSPWLVELVSNIPSIHLTPFSPPRKKLRFPHHPDFPLNPHIFQENHHNFPLGPCTIFAGIQGARHIPQFTNNSNIPTLPNLFLNKLDPSTLFPTHRPSKISSPFFMSSKPAIHSNSVSCLLSIGTPHDSNIVSCKGKSAPRLVLFGKPILTEEQISLKNSNAHCKVFMESEDVGRTLDLLVLGSYEELYEKLADMFGIEKEETKSRVVYCDAFGAVKHTGDEPFSEFKGKARRLTVLMDSSSDNRESTSY